jgi:hypothetical protein
MGTVDHTRGLLASPRLFNAYRPGHQRIIGAGGVANMTAAPARIDYCLDTHSKDARALGESGQRLHLLAAWREAPCCDSREQAALAWCEDLT